ncbi:MAG: hypothetical protein JKY65_27735 [Planctomycetes bacterium]|nr:hypothetical protein [Planctomycetota bacterium]
MAKKATKKKATKKATKKKATKKKAAKKKATKKKAAKKKATKKKATKKKATKKKATKKKAATADQVAVKTLIRQNTRQAKRIAELEADVERLELAAERAKGRSSKVRAELREHQGAQENLQAQVKEHRRTSRLASLKVKEAESYESKVSNLQGDLKLAREIAESARSAASDAESLAGDLAGARTRITELEATIDGNSTQMQRLQGVTRDAELTQERAEKLAKSLRERSDDLDSARREIREMNMQASLSTQELKRLRRALDEG